MKFKYAFFALCLLCISFTAAGRARPDNEPFKIQSFTQKAGKTDPVLHLVIRDSQSQSAVCDYYVKTFQYIKTLQVLAVELERGPCLNDGFGKSKADVYWRIPVEIRKTDVRLCVTVNQNSTAILNFDEEKQAFVVDENETCTALNDRGN